MASVIPSKWGIPQWTTCLTPEEEETAKNLCKVYLEGSPLAIACATQGVVIDTYYDNCIVDMAAGADPATALETRDELWEDCKAIIKEKEFESEKEGVPLSPEVEEVLIKVEQNCEMDCNGNGECNDGVCACNPGFSGTICEMDLSNPLPPSCISVSPSKVESGQSIMIQGSNLEWVTTCHFHDDVCSSQANVVNPNMITCSVPACAPAGQVSVSLSTSEHECSLNVTIEVPDFHTCTSEVTFQFVVDYKNSMAYRCSSRVCSKLVFDGDSSPDGWTAMTDLVYLFGVADGQVYGYNANGLLVIKGPNDVSNSTIVENTEWSAVKDSATPAVTDRHDDLFKTADYHWYVNGEGVGYRFMNNLKKKLRFWPWKCPCLCD